jgi:serine/threonine protein kinase
MNNTATREREIFLAALDYDHPDDQVEFLNRACGEDSSLRDRIVALLKADALSEGFLQIPVETSPAAIPSQVGPFTLGELVGRGGMGAVYRAWDDRLARYVAIKLLQGLAAADPAAATRFRHEARVTARLQHPGVPPIHEVGELSDHRPYLAMKLVEGRTLAELLRARQDVTADRGRFVAAFEQVCQTVAFAHAQGVIHRDLKPANVMVGAFSEVQVMDWGLAKVLAEGDTLSDKSIPEQPAAEPPSNDELQTFWSANIQTPVVGDSDPTRAGAVLGTPGYMAPEQARGEAADCRSDVFGLGAVLCDILTGSAPFVGVSTADTLRLNAVGDQSPARARLADCGADPELVAICEQCLASDPANRPLHAGAVAEAVAAWRGRAEERARQAERDRAAAATRVVEEQKRRRVAQWAAALIAAVLLLGVTGTGWGLLKEQASRQQAVIQRDRAAAARDRALDALDAVTSTVAERSLYSQTAISPEQKKFLSSVVNTYRELAAEQGDDEDSRRRVASAQFRLAIIEHRLGRSAEAEAKYRETIATAENQADHSAYRTHYRRLVAQARSNLAALLLETDRVAEAEPELIASLAIWSELVQQASSLADDRIGRAKSQIVLGNLYNDQSRAKDSEAAFRLADADLAQLASDEPHVTEYRALRGNAAANLSDLLLSGRNRSAEAEATATAAIALLQPAVTEQPAKPEYREWLARSFAQRAAALFNLGRTADAVESQRSAVTAWERLVADYPSVTIYRERLGKGLIGLARTLALTGHEAEAEAPFRAAVAVAERLNADYPKVASHRSELSGYRQSLGQILIQLKRPVEAEPILRAAVAVCDELAAEKPTSAERWARAARASGTLSQCLETTNRLKEAEVASRQAVTAAERARTAEPGEASYASLLAAIEGNHGALLVRAGQQAESIPWFTRSADTLAPLHAANPAAPLVRLYLRNAHGRRAEALSKLGRHADALPDLDRAVELSIPKEKPEYRAARAVALSRIGRTANAVAEATELADDPNCASDVLFELCRVYALAAAAVPAQANDYAKRAVELLRRAKDKSKKGIDLSGLATDADLVSLQGREDFQRLIGQAELAPPPRSNKAAGKP